MMGNAIEKARLLILGASELQVPALLRGHELGFHVACADRDSLAPGVALCDEFFQVSTTDTDGILRIARKFRPSGIITIGTDMPMRSVARVCADLGLPGPSSTAAFAATDKGAMARAFDRHSVAAPKSVVVANVGELQSATAGWEVPFILKPIDSSGSRGVTLVHSDQEYEGAFCYSSRFSNKAGAIAQEFLKGQEVSVEAFCIGSEVHVVTITDKVTTGAPHFVELGHSQPSTLQGQSRDDVTTLTCNAARALGLDNCAIHAEIMVTAQGPKILELGARLGGDFITSHLVPLSTGVDMVGALINLACRRPIDLRPRHAAGSAVRFVSSSAMLSTDPELIRQAATRRGVVSLHIARGSLDGPLRSSSDRLGHVIATAPTALESIAICDQTFAALRRPLFEPSSYSQDRHL